MLFVAFLSRHHSFAQSCVIIYSVFFLFFRVSSLPLLLPRFLNVRYSSGIIRCLYFASVSSCAHSQGSRSIIRIVIFVMEEAGRRNKLYLFILTKWERKQVRDVAVFSRQWNFDVRLYPTKSLFARENLRIWFFVA